MQLVKYNKNGIIKTREVKVGELMLELWQIITIIVVLLVVLTLAIIIFASKKKNKVKIDDSFLDILITSLGGLTNIISVDVDNKRIKFAVNNVNLTHPNDLKDKLNASGVGDVFKSIIEDMKQSYE